MTLKLNTTLIASLLVITVFSFFAAFQFSDAGEGGKYAWRCDIQSQTAVAIGADTSTEVVAAHSRNAYVLIQQPENATNTVSLGFGGTAVIGTDTILIDKGVSTTPDSFALGLNTDFPYVGSVEAITDLGSSTVLVTVCRY